jgi:hypothetical protein
VTCRLFREDGRAAHRTFGTVCLLTNQQSALVYILEYIEHSVITVQAYELDVCSKKRRDRSQYVKTEHLMQNTGCH